METKGVSTFEISWITLNGVSFTLEVNLFTDLLDPMFEAYDLWQINILSSLCSHLKVI